MGLPTGVSVGLNTALILPVPSDSNRYYLIYSYESNKKPNTVGGLYYTIIDMRLDSGRGDVSLTKSVQIAKISGFYGINVNTIKDNNSINWWLVYPQDDSVIVSLKVDSSGIKNPYYSYVRTNTFMAGHIRGSHNGKKLLAGNHPTDLNYSAILFDFDSKSGKVSNPQNLHYNNPKDKKKRYNTSSIEFSDNDSFLYTSVANNYNDYEKKIWQYEVYAADPDKTEQVIATIKPDLFTPPGLQIGPDNKIYTGTYGTQYMGVINYPEKKGLGCKYIDSAFSIAPEYCGFIMPSIYAPLHTIQWQAVGFCRDSISFKNLSDFRYFKYFK